MLMTEREYNIEVLCTCYSFEELELRLCKLQDGITQNGPDVIDDITIEELNEAIACYFEEKYKRIRNEMLKDRIRYGLI